MTDNLKSLNIFTLSGTLKNRASLIMLQLHNKENESQQVDYLPAQKN